MRRTLGASSAPLAVRMRAEGYSTLQEAEAHYTGGENPMSALNYAWFQYRWQRLAAEMFQADGEDGLVRFWECFHARDPGSAGTTTAMSLGRLLTSEVSHVLGRAVSSWRE